jgi:hypothetical protein
MPLTDTSEITVVTNQFVFEIFLFHVLKSFVSGEAFETLASLTHEIPSAHFAQLIN